MSAVEENIRRVNSKLQQMLKQYTHLQKENAQLRASIAALQTNHEKDMLQIARLEEQTGILKSVSGKMNDADKKMFEKHISQYIKEIDKCIGLLSE